jgi:dipeptidyl-peptidase-4
MLQRTLQGLRPRFSSFVSVLIVLAAFPVTGLAQEADPEAKPEADASVVDVARIYASGDFRGDRFGPARWLDDGHAYTTLERSEETRGGRDIVRYDTESGERSILVAAASLIPAGAEKPLAINGYEWSPDGDQLLIYTNSQRVWRTNTRGDYWVLNLTGDDLRQLGPDFEESTLMFAKFSPQGDRVGYVQGNDLYVEDLASGEITRLTEDGSRTIINGNFDWVYEEEFQIQDGWRWSPDGSRIAFWQLDAEGVRDFLMMNNVDSLYSFTVPVQFPMAGEMNSAAKVGVVPASGGDVVWFDSPGDLRDNYIPRMEWSGNSDEIIIQRMNRLQNTNQIMLGDVRSGEMKTIYTETDIAYLDSVDDWQWLDGDDRFVWISEQNGWRHVYTVSRDGQEVRPVTSGDDWEIVSVQLIDEDGGWLYFMASPETATRRYLYRTRLDGSGSPERLTPEDEEGWHRYNISPNGRFALHTWSSFGTPSTTELVALPDSRTVRTLVDNEKLKGVVAELDRGRHEFFTVDVEGTSLDAWIMYPSDFDPNKTYPVLFYAYSEPWAQTVMDAWGGANYLWHVGLTQQGYVVASVDNRGTPGPRGRDFRKAMYAKIGVLNVSDQANAARAIVSAPYLDENRVAIWGWSGGGEVSLNAIFQYPDVYGTAMAVAAVSHQKFYDTIYTERYMGMPDENAAAYEAGAPVTHAKNLEGNLLVVHGTGDDNVHYQNMEVLINEMVENNKHFTMMAYPMRSHGIFEGPGNTRLHLFNLLTRYLNENVPVGDQPPTS